jgi:predicted Abi (CAAX) family protease
MCDYSLQSVRSRPAKIGDKLVTKDFGTGTSGFASVTDASTAVCVLAGTELAFASEVRHADWTIRSLFRGTPAVREFLFVLLAVVMVAAIAVTLGFEGL